VYGQDVLADRYELHDLLGCGGMAEVYDAWDRRLGRAVAVKMLHSSLQTQESIRRRFEDEARSAASLSHPNIVAVYDYGDQGGTPFIVMERLPGTTLAEVFEQGPMRPDHVRAMLNDVLAALEAAHGAGILHRDIKPGNLLLSTNNDRIQVADFGIAKTGGNAHTLTGQIIGTIAYMSPERVSGAPASVADDLYAVGLVGYEALAGRHAYPEDSPGALALAIMDAPPPSIATLRPDIDPALAATIDGALARSPQNRFSSATEMRAVLAGNVVPMRPPTGVLSQPLPPSATYSLPPPPRRRVPTKARRGLAAAGVLAALVVTSLAFATDPMPVAPASEPATTSTTLPAPPPPAAPTVPPVPANTLVPTASPVAVAPVVQPEAPRPDKKAPKPGKGNGNGKGN
jgi:serine/threonine-protein kinase